MTYYIHKQKTGVTIMKLYQKIARVASQKNWAKRSKELSLLQELLPNGNGIRRQEGLAVILLESTEKRIVIEMDSTSSSNNT